MEKQFCRVRSANDILISCVLINVGAIMLFSEFEVGIRVAGLFLFLIGFLFLFLLKSVYKDKEDKRNIHYHKKELYFQHKTLNALLLNVITNPQEIDAASVGQGWTVKLNIYYSKSAGIAYLQLFEYIPYKYEPCTELLEWKYEKIASLIK